jgi:hypothetical protein
MPVPKKEGTPSGATRAEGRGQNGMLSVRYMPFVNSDTDTILNRQSIKLSNRYCYFEQSLWKRAHIATMGS